MYSGGDKNTPQYIDFFLPSAIISAIISSEVIFR